jgi:hypothetical protein
MSFLRAMTKFFDRLEDRIRGRLSRYPIVYASIGAAGVVLIWKGVWETAEYAPQLYGPGSIILGAALLLASGLFVSVFIGDSIILSGLRGSKKLAEKTIDEINEDESRVVRMERALTRIEKKLGTDAPDARADKK